MAKTNACFITFEVLLKSFLHFNTTYGLSYLQRARWPQAVNKIKKVGAQPIDQNYL